MMELLKLFWMFAKIGFLTVGGGMAIVPMIQQTLSEAGIMTLNETIDMVGISQMTPGPFAVNAATFAGMRLYGVTGAAVATFGVTLTCFTLTMVVAKYFFSFRSSRLMQSALSGVRPVVVGLILASAVSIAQTGLWMEQSFDWQCALLAVVCFGTLLFVKKLQPVMLIVICGVLGAFFLR